MGVASVSRVCSLAHSPRLSGWLWASPESRPSECCRRGTREASDPSGGGEPFQEEAVQSLALRGTWRGRWPFVVAPGWGVE